MCDKVQCGEYLWFFDLGLMFRSQKLKLVKKKKSKQKYINCDEIEL